MFKPLIKAADDKNIASFWLSTAGQRRNACTFGGDMVLCLLATVVKLFTHHQYKHLIWESPSEVTSPNLHI